MKVLYLTREESAVVVKALTVYMLALRADEFGSHEEAEQGMRARHNLAKSARRKVEAFEESRDR